MKRKRILMVGDNWEYIRYYMVEKLDLRVTLFQTPERKSCVKEELCEAVYYFPFDDHDKGILLAKELHQKEEFDAVWTFSEVGGELASLIGEALMLPCNSSEAERIAREKSRLRERLNKNNVSRVEFLVTDQVEQALGFSNRVGFPVMLKPVDSSGSRQIYKAMNEDQLRCSFQSVRDTDHRVLIEEYLEGTEVSVEFITFDGIHYPLQITDKIVSDTTYVEMGHTMPAQLDKQTWNSIIELVKKMLTLIGHWIGPTHTEVKITNKGIKIIETHTRPGGDFIPYMLDKVFGVDVFVLTINHLLGMKKQMSIMQDKGAAVRYFEAEPGVIQSIQGIEKVKDDPHVLIVDFERKAGEQVAEAKDSFSRPGCLVVSAETPQKAAEVADYLKNKVNIYTNRKINTKEDD
ncbi:ATP-grasp domain-containing protein [Desmospora profundinema]|uniref:Biotin carboxylase n=1 Tax=Desmospora profundinema TaxID=1571184 RepID=A0ABU1IJ07_9BACL|nr:ATP-grasp domain-containing protein [Desmospora profundinema]MDR6224743.1 biotin carboxylase [Desmospora profundinema]